MSKKVLTFNLHKLYEALLRTKIKYIDVSKCDKRNVVEAEVMPTKKRKILHLMSQEREPAEKPRMW